MIYLMHQVDRFPQIDRSVADGGHVAVFMVFTPQCSPQFLSDKWDNISVIASCKLIKKHD